jgi:hypothetical protein
MLYFLGMWSKKLLGRLQIKIFGTCFAEIKLGGGAEYVQCCSKLQSSLHYAPWWHYVLVFT